MRFSRLAVCLLPALVALPTAAAGAALVNASFETVEPTSQAHPQTFGDWSGDSSAIVQSEQSLTPADGAQMLRFRDTVSGGTGGIDSAVWQLVDVSGLGLQTSGRRATAIASVLFNRTGASYPTFWLSLESYSGGAEGFDSATALLEMKMQIQADDLVGTWQEAFVCLMLPSETTYVAVELVTYKGQGGGGTSPEFPGSYADDVRLVFYTNDDFEADADGSGDVGAGDYALWAAQFGQTGGRLSADFDHSCDVGAADYALWASHFGRTNPAQSAAVPEPATWMLALGALGTLLAWRGLARPAK